MTHRNELSEIIFEEIEMEKCTNCDDGYHKINHIHMYPSGPGVSEDFHYEECEECHGYGEIESKITKEATDD